MTQVTLTPPPVHSTGPKPYRWTCAEFHDLCDRAWFRGRRVILINGSILEMTQPGPPHNLCLGLVDDWLRVVFAADHHIRCQMALDIGVDNDPGPDLAAVAGSRWDLEDRQATTAVLVVEIADSSLFLDTTTKAELYATAGVPEYWVFDLTGQRLLVFRDPVPLPNGLGATAYRTHLTLGRGDTVSPLAAPAATVSIADLLPRQR